MTEFIPEMFKLVTETVWWGVYYFAMVDSTEALMYMYIH